MTLEVALTLAGIGLTTFSLGTWDALRRLMRLEEHKADARVKERRAVDLEQLRSELVRLQAQVDANEAQLKSTISAVTMGRATTRR